MKKLIALLIVIAFVAGLVGMASAASPAKIRAYIGVLNRKLAVAKANKNWARVAKLKKMIAVQEARIATTAPSVAVPPPPTKVAPAPAGALLGWGIDVAGSAGYFTGNKNAFVRADVLFADPLGLGPIVGLAADSVKYKVGLGYTYGSDINKVRIKAVPLYVDGVIEIPADVLGGIESYIGGGINYLLARSGGSTGSLGGQVYYGIQGDLGLGMPGKTFAQIGYFIQRNGETEVANFPRSSKGVGLEVGQTLTL